MAEALSAGWAIGADRIEHAPVGFGSHHWWAEADGRRWFVTVDDLDLKRRTAAEPLDRPRVRLRSALESARALSDGGLDFVIAPMPSRSDDVIEPIGDRFAIAVYPEVLGQSSTWGSYPTRAARFAVVDRLASLHHVPLDAVPMAVVDEFSIPKRLELEQSIAELSVPWVTGPFGEPAFELLSEHATAVMEVLGRFDQLASVVAGRSTRNVLTHGEPHPGNTITTDRGVVLVDWDTALVAPPERDLWALVEEDPAVAQHYTESTNTVIEPEALELYRLSWDLTEIALYIDDFRHPHVEDDDTRTAWSGLQRHLDPTRWA